MSQIDFILVISILSILAVLQQWQLHRVRGALNDLVAQVSQNAGQAREGAGDRVRYPIWESIYALGCRIAALSWRVQSLVELQPEHYARSIVERATDQGHSESSDELVRLVEDELLRALRSDTSCLITAIYRVLSNGQVSVRTDGARGRRLVAGIRTVLERPVVEELSETSADQHIESPWIENTTETFSIFGVSRWMAFPLRRGFTDGDGERAILWCGFRSGWYQREGIDQQRWFSVFLQELQLLLESRRQLLQLKKQTLEHTRASRQKSKYLAHFSHDIRSPLNNIRLILQQTQGSSALNHGEHELLQEALENCSALNEIVQSILDYSRHTCGVLKAFPTVTDLSQLVREVYESFRFAAGSKGLKFQFENLQPDGGSCYVFADAAQIKRAISNITGNAIKYTARGQVQIVLMPHKDARILLRVVDSGIGMSSEDLKELFAPFARFQSETFDGIGLGMTVSKVLLDLNGVAIDVESVEKQGTVFQLHFERASSGEVKTAMSAFCSSSSTAEGDSNSTLNADTPLPERATSVLVVDDNVDYVEALSRVLRERGYKVCEALSVSDAVALCNFELPDVVVADRGMPDGGGERLIEFLNAAGKTAPPTMIASGDDNREVHVRLRRLGAWAVQVKPIDIDCLCSWIESVVSGSAAAA